MNSILEFHNHLPLLPAPPTTGHQDGASTSISTAKRPRKKRLNSKQPLQNGVVSVSAAADNNIAKACSECGKKFCSWKALFGHMRCHPERHWRGINRPPKHRRPASPVLTTTTRPLNDNLDDFEVASCLLLLANNGSDTITAATTADNTIIHDHHQTNYDAVEANNNGTTTTTTFECSSCKKVFRSHQALGGHRASHKNVKGCFAMARSSRSTTGGDHHDHHDAVGTCCRSNNSTFGLDFDLNLPAVREDNGGCCLVSSSSSSSHHPGQLANLDLRLGL